MFHLKVSLRLHERPENSDIPKDYTLQQQSAAANASHMTQNTYIFTEKDIPGAENRMAVFGETRSALYETMKRDARRREQGKRWEPYVRKTVPSTYDLNMLSRSATHTYRTNGTYRTSWA